VQHLPLFTHFGPRRNPKRPAKQKKTRRSLCPCRLSIKINRRCGPFRPGRYGKKGAMDCKIREDLATVKGLDGLMRKSRFGTVSSPQREPLAVEES
jgi:hypothetical protein